MKLEVGMYVRTKQGIAKVKAMYVEPNQYIVYTDKDITFEYYLNDKGKWVADYSYGYSSNIIDLIEVGDILKINNEKYEVIYDESYEKLGILIPSRKELSIRHSALEYVFKKYNVSIVTKEMFESMSYKVGD